MLTIILGILLLVVALLLIRLDKNKPFMTLIGVILITAVAVVGLWIMNEPFYGYEEAVLKEEITLEALNVSYKLDEETQIYLVTSTDEMYLFKSNERDELQTVGRNKVTYIQTVECKAPVLRIYEKKPKSGLFSFGGAFKTEFEFYLPENSVIEVS